MLYNLVATATSTPAGNSRATLLPFLIVIIGAIVWDTVQRKKIAKKKKVMMNELKVGDKVLTAAGLIGEIASISEENVEIKVDKGIRLEFRKQAVVSVIK